MTDDREIDPDLLALMIADAMESEARAVLEVEALGLMDPEVMIEMAVKVMLGQDPGADVPDAGPRMGSQLSLSDGGRVLTPKETRDYIASEIEKHIHRTPKKREVNFVRSWLIARQGEVRARPEIVRAIEDGKSEAYTIYGKTLKVKAGHGKSW